jgi:methionyl-tRNA formyltransferase
VDTIRFFPKGGLRRILVLGVGQACKAVVEWSVRHSIAVGLVTGSRHASKEDAISSSILDELKGRNVPITIADDLPSAPAGPYAIDPAGVLLLSFGSPYILRKDLLERYEGRVVNSHGAPLPAWRGGGGFSWRIMAGDRRGTVCLHVVTEGIDDGDIIFKSEFEFPLTVRFPSDYFAYQASKEHDAIGAFLDDVLEGKPFARGRQDERASTYYPRLHSATHGFIDWERSGEEIERLILAFSYPYSGATTYVNGQHPIAFQDARFHRETLPYHSFFNGLVVRADAQALSVQIRDGLLIVPRQHIAPTSTSPSLGDRLLTPRRLLDDARAIRVQYGPSGRRPT